MTGVRSSWEASATNRRRRASDAVRWSKASSMRPSMPLRATPRSPASVPGAALGHALRQVAGGDGAGGRGHPLHGPDAEADDPPRHERRARPSTASTAVASTAIRRRTASSTSSSGRASDRGRRRAGRLAPRHHPVATSASSLATVTVCPSRSASTSLSVEHRARARRRQVGGGPDRRGRRRRSGRRRTKRLSGGGPPARAPAPARSPTCSSGRLRAGASTWSTRWARVVRAMATAATREHEGDERRPEQQAGPERHGATAGRAACSRRRGWCG